MKLVAGLSLLYNIISLCVCEAVSNSSGEFEVYIHKIYCMCRLGLLVSRARPSPRPSVCHRGEGLARETIGL